jgi:hypothetical protein
MLLCRILAPLPQLVNEYYYALRAAYSFGIIRLWRVYENNLEDGYGRSVSREG